MVEKRLPTPLEDADYYLRKAGEKLSSRWIGVWGRVRDARHYLEQARLALHAHHEQESAVVLKK